MFKMLKALFCLFVLVALASAASLPKSYNYNTIVDIDSLPRPDELVTKLSEDEYDNYLDYWLHQKFMNEIQNRPSIPKNGCTIPISTLTEPLPIYVTNDALVAADGTSGNIELTASQVVEAACTGSGLVHASGSSNPVSTTLSCSSGTSVTSSWITSSINFADIQCLSHPSFSTVELGTSCQSGGVQINSILTVGSREYDILTSCFEKDESKVLYVEYDQNPEHVYSQPNVARPTFVQGSHFPGLSVNTLYTQVAQKVAFDEILGEGMNLEYINTTYFLARGHLAAKTDYVLAPEQRATFTFVNAAPQWQPFNGGNWNTLEQNLRARIAAAGYKTRVYTGTWEILQLADSNGVFRELYLNPSTQQIPVPLWYFKVVYEPSTQRGIVYLGLNNPHVTLEEARALAFCTDVCADNTAFSWLNWRPEHIGYGFSICCEIDDFRRTVSYVPSFTTSGILA